MDTAALALALVTRGPLTPQAASALDLLQTLDNAIADLEEASRRRSRAAVRFNQIAALSAGALGAAGAALALPFPAVAAILGGLAAVFGACTAVKWVIADNHVDRREEDQLDALRETRKVTAWALVQCYLSDPEDPEER